MFKIGDLVTVDKYAAGPMWEGEFIVEAGARCAISAFSTGPFINVYSTWSNGWETLDVNSWEFAIFHVTFDFERCPHQIGLTR
jgi:hypothetical protein